MFFCFVWLLFFVRGMFNRKDLRRKRKDKGDFFFFTIEVISTEVNYPWYKNLTARLDYTWNSNTFEPPNLTEHHDEYLKMNSY